MKFEGRVRLRPHHLMCVHGFEGKGYSPEFVKNFWQVIERLNKSDQVEVEVVGSTQEDICAPCPNNTGIVCSDETKIRKLDQGYEVTLNVRVNDILSWKEVKHRIAAQVTDEAFEANCEPCSWKKLGVCKEALVKLRGLAPVLVFALMALSTFSAHAQQEEVPVEVPIPLALPAPVLDPMVGPTPSPAPAPAPVPNVSDLKGETTVEELEQKILLDKTKRIPAFNKVLAALSKKEYQKALDAAKALDAKTEFQDYTHFLKGQAEMGRMRKFIQEKKTANANFAGEQAVYHLTQTITANPYTALAKRTAMYLGETEVLLGELALKAKKKAKGLLLLERGFQRLSQVNLLALVPKPPIVSYAIICDKNRTDLCASWVAKLAPVMARTEHARMMEKIAAFRRPVIERTSTVPYRVDLDLQAFQKGFQYFLEKKYADAYGTFENLLREYPRTNIKLRTKFWMARSAQKAGLDAKAETIYREVIKEIPFSYYALLASWFGNIEITRAMDVALPPATSETPLLSPQDVLHIRRAEVLIASAAPELAMIELQDVRPTLSMPNEFLVYLTALHHLAGNHQAAFQVFGELSSRNFQGIFSSYGQKLLFPTTHMPLIRELSREQKVDPLLVISVVKQESAFNHEAVSVANAFGLMQIIGPTARDLDPKIDLIDLFKPHYNIKLGSKYINQLLGRYRGNVVLALAAYNAGPGNSDRWSRDIPKDAPQEEFIEQITFKETREYVQNILRNYYWYSKRVKGEAFPSLTALTASFSGNTVKR